MTNGINNLTTNFNTAIRQLESQRSFAGAFFGSDDNKHVRFSAEKGLYLHSAWKRSGSGRNAAIKRATKRADGAAAIRKTLENSVGKPVADIMMAKWSQATGKTMKGLAKGVTLGDLKKLRDIASSPQFVFNGVKQTRSASPKFREAVRDMMQNKLERDLNNPDKFKAYGPVHENMAKDFGRTHVMINGNTVSGTTAEVGVETHDQPASSPKAFRDAGIPEHDTKVLSTLMHQGIFADLLLVTKDDVKGSPVPATFSISNKHTDPSKRLDTIIQKDKTKAGAYNFTVRNAGDLNAVQEFPEDPKDRAITHHLKPGGVGAYSMTGSITVGSEDGSVPPKVTLDTFDASYTAELARSEPN